MGTEGWLTRVCILLDHRPIHSEMVNHLHNDSFAGGFASGILGDLVEPSDS
jgi:hypothetical protein